MTRKLAVGFCAFALGVSGTVQAAPVSGQGTWETTLLGRDLDGNAATFEAYYDTVLGITWLANANAGAGSSYDNGTNTTDGRMTWQNAVDWAASLSFTVGTTTYDDWRLPTVGPVNGSTFNYAFSGNGSTDVGYGNTSVYSELSHMYYVTLGDKSYYDTAGVVPSAWGLINTGPFSNLQSSVYWSGTEYSSVLAWLFDGSSGRQGLNGKSGYNYAWAVRPGDVLVAAAAPPPSVPLPAALPLFASALVGLGLVARRRKKLVA